MRKALKQNLLEIFKTIYEAHEIVKGFIDKKEYENAQNLLADCQDTAIQLGNLIEESEGEGFVTVSFLEEYCEALYEAATSLSEESNGHKVQKQLDKKIIKAENSAKNDIKVKLEIVFMPYKASMWDSLESVWKAADEDPDCDAYVVPIPYYDRNPDHSFGEFHYEGNEYPDYVPVTHYEAYNLEQRRPDVIYIHNPYDGNNYVTSVDPRFYSSELKKYTNKLVYIPYFVVSDNVPEHFCTAPGCIYADDVIVQSETVRDTYIDIIVKNNISTLKAASEKFVALGSPKFDCVVNKTPCDYVLPEEWKRKIEHKKVILYNTSVSAILNGNVQYLEKIKSVLNYFSEHREVVLWWRPHPLSEAVYDSMRHGLVDAYLNLIEQYKNLNFGIYDDTPDLHRAICLSDAYYGDRSSLVALYQLTGKPVMIQNVNVCKYELSKFNIMFEDVYDDGQYLWFCSFYFNGLFRIKKENMTIEFMGIFPDEPLIGHRLYSSILYYEGKLFFTPLSANSICIFDLETKTFKKLKYELSNSDVLYPNAAYYYSVIYNDKLIFIPYASKKILILDTKDNSINYYDGWAEQLTDENTFGFFRKGVIINNKLVLPCVYSNKILIFDLNSYLFEIVKVDNNNWKTQGVYEHNNKLVMCSKNGELIVYDIVKRTFERYCVEVNYLSATDVAFSDCCCLKDKYLLFPYQANGVLELNDKLIIDATTKFGEGQFVFAKAVGDTIYAYDVRNAQLLICEPKSEIRKEIIFDVESIANFREIKANAVQKAVFINEYPDSYNILEHKNNFGTINISDFVYYYSKGDNVSTEADYRYSVQKRRSVRGNTLSNPDGTSGSKIHKYIKDRC